MRVNDRSIGYFQLGFEVADRFEERTHDTQTTRSKIVAACATDLGFNGDDLGRGSRDVNVFRDDLGRVQDRM